MDKEKETFETWNNIASVYEDKFMDLDLYNETYDHFCNTLTKQIAKILDVGCGPGNIIKYLISKNPDYDIFGIDIAPNMIELAEKNNPSASFAVMDTRDIGKLEPNFNGIIAGFCLPYLSQSESQDFMANAFNLLDKQGVLYISFVEGNPQQSDFKTGGGGRVYFYYHQLDELKKTLVETGFSEIAVFKVNYKTSDTTFDVHTIVTARKV